MRIAYICADPGVPVYGCKGSSIHVQAVIRSLLTLGARVELIAARLGGDPPPELEAVRLYRLPPLPKGEPAARELAALAVNHDLRAALDRAGAFDLIYERYSIWSFAAMEAAQGRAVPGLLEVNAPLIEEQALYRGLVNRVAAEQVAGRVFAAATRLIAVSDEVSAYLKSFPGTAARVQVLPNGVSPARFPVNLRPSRPGRPGEFTVGFVGSLKPWHGLEVLVEAFARFHRRRRKSRLLVVGSGPEQARMQTELTRRGLSQAAEFTGMVDPGEVPGLLASMDATAAPYPQVERFYFSPLKVYEYMAAGRATVASRVGQIAGLIEDGETGLLCPPGDPAALAAAFDRLHTEPELRRRLGQSARDKVLREHTWEANAWRILQLAGLHPSPLIQSREALA